MITCGGDAAAALVGGGEAHEADPDTRPAHGGNGDDQRTEAARKLSACFLLN